MVLGCRPPHRVHPASGDVSAVHAQPDGAESHLGIGLPRLAAAHFSDPWYRTDRCVDELLYWGKVLYIMEQCMPDAPKADLLDWTPEAWVWAEAHERDIWLELQPQDALFDTDRTQFGKWFNEGPFTRYGAIPQDSPTGSAYMGWRMVSDFMDKHPEVDLAALWN